MRIVQNRLGYQRLRHNLVVSLKKLFVNSHKGSLAYSGCGLFSREVAGLFLHPEAYGSSSYCARCHKNDFQTHVFQIRKNPCYQVYPSEIEFPVWVGQCRGSQFYYQPLCVLQFFAVIHQITFLLVFIFKGHL